MERIIEQYKRLVNHTEVHFLRYLHGKIDWNNRLTAITGARGVGKTTLILQHIKLHLNIDETLYVSADDIYFSENKLFDLASDFYKNKGSYLFIDEIHKYANWSKELKMIYDNLPDLKVVFTGSSILDIHKGSDDLSRRVLTYHLHGMSFREYLNLTLNKNFSTYTLDDILQNTITIPEFDFPLFHFKNYLKKGYYPFYAETGYYERLNNIINLTLETDIPSFVNMNISTSKKLKQLLYIISNSVPFKPNYTKIGTGIGVHRNQVNDFMFYLERAEIITQLRNPAKGIRLLGKTEKVYLNNTNLIYAIGAVSPNIGNIRETFFFNQMKLNYKVLFSKTNDFEIGKYTFEVGGRSKNKKQIENNKNAFLIKDDIEYGYGNIIPLWLYGFTY